MIKFIGKQRFDLRNASFTELRQKISRDFIVGVSNDFASFLIEDVTGQHTTQNEIVRNANLLNTSLLQVTNMLGGDTLVSRHNFLTIFIADGETSCLTLQAFFNKRKQRTSRSKRNGVKTKETGKNIFRRHPDSLQQNRARHLAAAVHTEVKNILGVKFKVQPRTAVRNHTSREEQLPGGVRLTFVMFKEDARRTMQLTHNHAFSAVHDERTLLSHERDFTHVDIIFTNFFDGTRGSGFTIKNFQLDLRTKTAGVGQTTELAFSNVKFRLFKSVFEEGEASITIVANDREDGGKGRL